ncbi:MAG: hypothetical protein ABH846_00705 [Patescibacteria group bacterium]
MTKQGKKKISLTKRLLVELEETAGSIYENGMNTYRWNSVRYPKDVQTMIEKRKIYHRLKSLERQKFIKLKKEGVEISYKITNEGWENALRTKILSCEKQLPEGELCVVAFDFPEKIKGTRMTFRNLLKRAGFRLIQRSVWESENDVIFELTEFVNKIGAQKYVNVYRAIRLM